MDRITLALVAALVSSSPFAAAQENAPPRVEQDAGDPALPFPAKFDAARYLGKWYEVARLPSPVQPAGTLAVAEYSAGAKEGEIVVRNTACSAEGERLVSIEGTARLMPDDPPRLAVSFGPFVAKEPNYFVIHVDEHYEHAVVGTPDRKSLWILARKVPVSAEVRDALVAIAKDAGFDTQALFFGPWKADSGE